MVRSEAPRGPNRSAAPITKGNRRYGYWAGRRSDAGNRPPKIAMVASTAPPTRRDSSSAARRPMRTPVGPAPGSQVSQGGKTGTTTNAPRKYTAHQRPRAATARPVGGHTGEMEGPIVA